MRTVAIILGDNDFGNTFYPLLHTLHGVFYYHSGNVDEEFIRRVIFEGIGFHYIAYQVGANHPLPDADTLRNTIKSLEKVKILFDVEAENDIATKDHNHGAWYLELQSGNIQSY